MANEPLDLRLPYFETLRREIKATKARIFCILMAGIIGAPILTYAASVSESHVLMMVAPFLVLLLLVLYLSEQTLLMRAARYLRENVEAGEKDWEHWIGSTRQRSAEQQMFALFVVIGLFLYVLLLMRAVEFIRADQAVPIRTYSYYFWGYGTLIMYVVATLWALVTLLRFWRHAVVNQ